VESISVTIKTIFCFEAYHTDFTGVCSMVVVHFKVLLHIANVNGDLVAEKALHLAAVRKFG
jgi:hypothetical protein